MVGDLKTEIEKIVTPILAEQLFDLVEMKLSRYRKNFRLQIFIDSDQGVGLDDCARISGLIGAAIDLTDFMDEGYILEVSSPGIDRPLHSEVDFRRRVGRNVLINVVENGRERSVRGVLTEVRNKALFLSGENGPLEIALNDVVQGKEIM